MLLTEIEQIVELSNKIRSVDFESIAQKQYSDKTNLEEIVFSKLSLPGFISLSKKVFEQFIVKLGDKELAAILPTTFTHPDISNASVLTQVRTYFDTIEGSLVNAEGSLIWLSLYQLEYGFFSVYEKTNDTVLKDEEKLSNRLLLLEKSLQTKMGEISFLQGETDSYKTALIDFIDQKTEELRIITNNLSTSNTQTNQIGELLTKATEQGSRIKSLLDQQQENKVAYDKNLAELETLYKTTNSALEQNLTSIQEKLTEFTRLATAHKIHLEFVEGKSDFFDERIEYLENLIGREVGASLFETFKQRKNELNKSVQFWTAAVPIMAIITIIWIFFIFKNQNNTIDPTLWWESFALNTFKSVPAVLLLLFTINQYRKERNFQEEYAFKSAVALTIDAYANRLSDAANKDRLIFESVTGIYKTPIEEGRQRAYKSKSVLDTLKTVAETAQELAKGK